MNSYRFLIERKDDFRSQLIWMSIQSFFSLFLFANVPSSIQGAILHLISKSSYTQLQVTFAENQQTHVTWAGIEPRTS